MGNPMDHQSREAEDWEDQDDSDECPNCDGSGIIYECFDGQYLDADAGCDQCAARCDWCNPAKSKPNQTLPLPDV